ncbi:MAG: glycosyltransferase family 4 protein [bacterium]
MMKNRTKRKSCIYYVMDSFNRAGGLEHQCSRLAKRMKDPGYQVAVFSRKYVTKHNQYYRYFKENDIDLIQINYVLYHLLRSMVWLCVIMLYIVLSFMYWLKKRKSIVFTFSGFNKELGYELRRVEEYIFNITFIINLRIKGFFKKPDVLHVVSPYPATMISLKWAEKEGIALVYDEQFMAGFDYHKEKYQQIYRVASVFKVLSYALGEHAAKYIPSNLKLVVIPPLLDMPRFLEKKNDSQLTIGSIGRVEHEKGFEFFIEAAKEVHEIFPSVKYVLVGEGRFLSQMKKMVSDLGLEGCFVFKGYLPHDDIHLFLSEIDIYVQSSRTEGAGIAIVEAMSHGKPVISTACGGPVSLVKEGETGLLIPPKEPKCLAAALMRLINNPSERLRMGKNGREVFLREHNPNDMVEQYIQMYEELINNKTCKLSKK